MSVWDELAKPRKHLLTLLKSLVNFISYLLNFSWSPEGSNQTSVPSTAGEEGSLGSSSAQCYPGLLSTGGEKHGTGCLRNDFFCLLLMTVFSTSFVLLGSWGWSTSYPLFLPVSFYRQTELWVEVFVPEVRMHSKATLQEGDPKSCLEMIVSIL